MLPMNCVPFALRLWARTTVVRVRDALGQGAGVYIAPSLVLTAHHVVEAGNVRVGGAPAVVIGVNDDLDLALVRVPDIFPRRSPEVAIRETRPPFAAIRCALVKGETQTSVVLVHGVSRHLWATDRGWSGLSGGPLMDAEGKLIGIHQSSDHEYGYACRADVIERFLYQNTHYSTTAGGSV